jgi:microcin C transport system permease protein
MILSPTTRRQIKRFQSIRRAWFALIILCCLYFLSLFSEQIANDKPLVLKYQGRLYFPTLAFYPGTSFGESRETEADYKALKRNPSFQEGGGWMLMPLVPYGPLKPDFEISGAPPHSPSKLHWLGTDTSSRDVVARLLYAFRTNISFALLLAVIGTVLGIAIGGIQGYVGGLLDLAGQRLIEIWSTLPFLYVVILLGSIYGQGFGILLLVFSLFQWIGLSYYMRGEFYSLKNRAFVQAAHALGTSHFRILFRHILPNALTPVITLLPFSVVGSISLLTALDFLGFGLPPPSPSWGEMLQQGLGALYKPWLAISSIGALFLTLLLASFVGEGARAAFDPKSNSNMQ